MKKNNFKTEDYIFIKEIKHLLRTNENIVFIAKTETDYTKFNTPGDKAKYVILGTGKRVIILAKSKLNEFSTSFSFSEIGSIVITKGFLFDKAKIHRYIFKLKKSESQKLAKLSEYIPVKLSIWKYPVLILTIAILTIFGVKGYHYLRYFYVPSIIVQQAESSNKTQNTNTVDAGTQQQNSIDKILNDIISGYDYSFNLILKNYPVFKRNPSLDGAAFSRFDEWAMVEIINNLDSQDSKLSSLNISLEKHILVRLGMSKLRLSIMNYLDICKKSFTNNQLQNKLSQMQKDIKDKIKELRDTLSP